MCFRMNAIRVISDVDISLHISQKTWVAILALVEHVTFFRIDSDRRFYEQWSCDTGLSALRKH